LFAANFFNLSPILWYNEFMPGSNPQPNKVTNFQLKFNYWYVTHKLQLRKGLIIFLILLSFSFYAYSIYKAVVILFIDDQNLNRELNYLSADSINYAYFHQVNQPKDLEILSFDSLAGRENRYDFVAKISNPNPQWFAANVLFQLLSGGKVIAEKNSFIYPGEEKYIAFFGQELTSFENPSLKVADIGWRRVHQFSDYALPRLNFTTSDIEFKSAQDSGIRGELPVSTLNFKITNNTAYSYWQVGVFMALLSGSDPVAVNYLSLDQFHSGETRNVEMRWYESLPSVQQIEILPEVDIFNSTSYMPVK